MIDDEVRQWRPRGVLFFLSQVLEQKIMIAVNRI